MGPIDVYYLLSLELCFWSKESLITPFEHIQTRSEHIQTRTDDYEAWAVVEQGVSTFREVLIP